MKVLIIENQSKEKIAELTLETQPRNGECVEFGQTLYSIHKVIHTESVIKLMVIGVR